MYLNTITMQNETFTATVTTELWTEMQK